jgi:tagatose-1,6-bisphosphate aldolase non-catalytic subunit AgaZ/GatZ
MQLPFPVSTGLENILDPELVFVLQEQLYSLAEVEEHLLIPVH